MLTAPATAIDGVTLVPLRTIADERGAVFHMLKATDPHFVAFGEIYFSSVYPGVVKGWKRHRRLTSNYACISGRIKLVLLDRRPGSLTAGALMELYLCPREYRLAIIPPGIWHAFQGVGQPLSIVANCATEPHDPDELDRLDPYSPGIPYYWSSRT